MFTQSNRIFLAALGIVLAVGIAGHFLGHAVAHQVTAFVARVGF